MDETRKSLLLVEDEAIIAMLEKQLLEKQGYAVSHVANGEAAVRLVAGDGAIFDVILMDIDLGHGMDGTQAAEAILATVDIPIVFVSSHTEPEVVGKTEKITSYGYVVKNTGIVVLDASITMALKLFREKVDRTRAQKLQLQSTAILGGINQPLTLREATRSIIGLIKQETDIDAVGIRLKDGEDYPYFCEDGLGEDFLLAENSVVEP